MNVRLGHLRWTDAKTIFTILLGFVLFNGIGWLFVHATQSDQYDLKYVMGLITRRTFLSAIAGDILILLGAFALTLVLIGVSIVILARTAREFRRAVVGIGLSAKVTPLGFYLLALSALPGVQYATLVHLRVLIIVPLVSFLPGLLEALRGIDSLPRRVISYYRHVVRSPRLWHIRLRFIAPGVLTALKVSWALGVIALSLAEFLFPSSDSLGELLANSQQWSSLGGYWAATVFLSFVGVAGLIALELCDERLNSWRIDRAEA